MKRFILEQSDDEFYTSHSGLALDGFCINRYSELSRVIGRKMDNTGNLISHTDILRSYLGLLCLGKSDYEAIMSMRQDTYFKNALGIKNFRLRKDCGSDLMMRLKNFCRLRKNVQWTC